MNELVFAALADVLRFQNLLASIVGVIFGLFIGAMPGLTISLGMVLLLPSRAAGAGAAPADVRRLTVGSKR